LARRRQAFADNKETAHHDDVLRKIVSAHRAADSRPDEFLHMQVHSRAHHDEVSEQFGTKLFTSEGQRK